MKLKKVRLSLKLSQNSVIKKKKTVFAFSLTHYEVLGYSKTVNNHVNHEKLVHSLVAWRKRGYPTERKPIDKVKSTFPRQWQAAYG